MRWAAHRSRCGTVDPTCKNSPPNVWHELEVPAQVHVDSFFACVQLRPPGKDDPIRLKQTALAADEAAWEAASGNTGDGEEPPKSAFMQKIIDNVEVHLTNVHVRFEDRVSCPAAPFAVGVTLDYLRSDSLTRLDSSISVLGRAHPLVPGNFLGAFTESL